MCLNDLGLTLFDEAIEESWEEGWEEPDSFATILAKDEERLRAIFQWEWLFH